MDLRHLLAVRHGSAFFAICAVLLVLTIPTANIAQEANKNAENAQLYSSGAAKELVNKPAIVDVPVGKGHVVMFATNPMWRHQTQGAFFLLFNAALNYDHLDVGRTEARGSRTRTADDDQ